MLKYFIKHHDANFLSLTREMLIELVMVLCSLGCFLKLDNSFLKTLEVLVNYPRYKREFQAGVFVSIVTEILDKI